MILAASLVAASCITLCTIAGCRGEEIQESKEEIVVEGWIADGEHPIVMVTSTLPIKEEDTQMDDLKKYVAQWARVGINTDDGTTVYLTARYDADYFPPYIFTTTAIRGQAGQRYHLTVDWRTHHAEATTTIPASVPLDDIWCEPCTDSDTLRQVMVQFHDQPASHDYYLLFSREKEEPLNPQLCLFGIIDDITLPTPEVTKSIRRGGLITEIKDYTPYYTIGDQVEVSLMHVDSLTYHYWHAFSDAKQLGGTLLFNITTPLTGNIQGGHGIWYGCGLDKKNVLVK